MDKQEYYSIENQNDDRDIIDTYSPVVKQRVSSSAIIPTMFPCHEKIVIDNLMEIERQPKLIPDYVDSQKEVVRDIKNLIVNWMVYVADKLNLLPETLFMSISLLRRYLQLDLVFKKKIHLKAAVTLFIATKYEEVKITSHLVFVDIVPLHNCTPEEFLQEELRILSILQFDINQPNVYDFFSNFCLLAQLDHVTRNMGLYICELTLIDSDVILGFYPSVTAAASIAFSRIILGEIIWSPALQNITNYCIEDLLPCLMELSKIYWLSSSHMYEAIRRIFSATRFDCVGTISPVLIEQDFFESLIEDFNKTQHLPTNKQ